MEPEVRSSVVTVSPAIRGERAGAASPSHAHTNTHTHTHTHTLTHGIGGRSCISNAGNSSGGACAVTVVKESNADMHMHMHSHTHAHRGWRGIWGLEAFHLLTGWRRQSWRVPLYSFRSFTEEKEAPQQKGARKTGEKNDSFSLSQRRLFKILATQCL